MSRKLRIGISGLNNTDNPGPGIPVIRCLQQSTRFDVEPIGLSYDALEPGIYMPGMAAASYLMPYPMTGYSNMLERLREIHAQSPLDMILPLLDSELTAYERMETPLREMGISTFLPTASNLDMRSKVNLVSFGRNTNTPVPYSEAVYSIAQLYAAMARFAYPVVVKGAFYEAKICYTYDDAVKAFSTITAKWGVPAILQQFVKGDEYNIAAVGDGTGETLGVVISKKLYITDKGKGWSGVAIRNHELLELATRVIRHLKWRGALELEMMRAENTGQYLLLEINPRFPAWIYLSAGVGINLPEMLVRLALGETPEPQFDYEPGTMFLRYSADLIMKMDELERMTIHSSYTTNGND